MKVIIDISLKQNYYDIVNWFLVNVNCYSFDTQKILNQACIYAEIGTIKLLRTYFYCLDINQAINHIFRASPLYFYSCNQHDQTQRSSYNHLTMACLDLFWEDIYHDTIDIRTLVSTACKEKQISNDVNDMDSSQSFD